MHSRIVIPKPNSAKQGVLIKSFMVPGLLELWVACGTKFGKTWGASAGLSQRSLTMQGAYCRWIAPIYAQTKIGFRYCKKIFPPEPYAKVDNSALALGIPAIDSFLEFKSGKNPEDLEGEGTHANVLDEAAKMKQQVYDSVKTTTTLTRGLIVPISTPRGKNWFYTKCMEAKEEMEHALRRGMEPTKLFMTAPTSANPAVSREAIEDARRSLPERLFRQYYEAEFIDDGTVFAGYRDVLEGPEIEFIGARERWIDPTHVGGTVVVGADWAKTVDYTVFTAFDISTRQLVGFERFYRTPYTEAIRKLVLFCRKFEDVFVVRHDKTGLGGVIDDQLSYTNLPYEGVTFTNANKAEMVAQLITSIEQKMVRLPRWRTMCEELEAFEVQTNQIGTMSYNAPPGKHDDIISSLLLSHSALVQYSDSGFEVTFIEDLNKPGGPADKGNTERKDVSPIEQFYLDASEDDDD
jgi:hypothetical protein